MPDFSIIVQSPQVRAIVQQNALERAFHDALFPRMLYRGEATPQACPAGIGDTFVFTAPGLIIPDMTPLVPGHDPDVATYQVEQWSAQLQKYGKAIDTDMPTSMVAIANMFLRNSHQLGLHAAQTMNRKVRNVMYNAALSGWTVSDGAPQSGTSLRVKRLNGFTRNRSAAGSVVRFDQVSPTNKLAITVFDNGSAHDCGVLGYVADTAGDEVGPGVLLLDAAMTSVADRSYVVSIDRAPLVRVDGGMSVDDLTTGSSIPTLADIRTAVAYVFDNNVPAHPDGRYHMHLDAVSQSKIFSDYEFTRLMTALPDYYAEKQFALGELLGCVFFRNSESPTASTVVGGLTATYDSRDPFAGELWTGGAPGVTWKGSRVHRMLLTGQGAIMEYYSDLENLLTEAGITGKVAEPKITNNGIEVFVDRIQLIIRAPLNIHQDIVTTSWKFIGDWPARTDAAVGGPERYKRLVAIEHCE